MGLPVLVGTVLASLKAVLLVVLAGVWLRNYRQFHSNLVPGLVGCSVVLLAENLVAVGFFLSSMHKPLRRRPAREPVVLATWVLQFVGVAFLTAVTLT